MKRYIAALLVTVLLVPLLAVPVWAETLVMTDVVGADKLPVGYVHPYWKGFSGEINRTNAGKDLFFYDGTNGMYYSISFLGTVTFMNSWNVGYYLKFSDPGSIQIRAYECKGRDIFAYTDDQEFVLHVPEQHFTSSFTGPFWAELEAHGLTFDKNIQWNYSYTTISGKYYVSQMTTQSGYNPPKKIIFSYTGTGDDVRISSIRTTGFGQDDGTIELKGSVFGHLPDLETIIEAYDIPLDIENLTMKSIDYYIIQRNTSGISTSIDYPLTWYQGDYLILGNTPVRGFPLAVSVYNNDLSSFLYDNGAYYRLDSSSRMVRLFNYEKMVQDENLKLETSIMNRFLSHFGYDTIYYSEQNAQLSNDIDAVGGTIGGWASAAGDYNSIASGSIASVQSSVLAFQPFFLGVWNILPSWFIVLLTVSIVIVIGRKILGR